MKFGDAINSLMFLLLSPTFIFAYFQFHSKEYVDLVMQRDPNARQKITKILKISAILMSISLFSFGGIGLFFILKSVDWFEPILVSSMTALLFIHILFFIMLSISYYYLYRNSRILFLSPLKNDEED